MVRWILVGCVFLAGCATNEVMKAEGYYDPPEKRWGAATVSGLDDLKKKIDALTLGYIEGASRAQRTQDGLSIATLGIAGGVALSAISGAPDKSLLGLAFTGVGVDQANKRIAAKATIVGMLGAARKLNCVSAAIGQYKEALGGRSRNAVAPTHAVVKDIMLEARAATVMDPADFSAALKALREASTGTLSGFLPNEMSTSETDRNFALYLSAIETCRKGGGASGAAAAQ